MIGSVGGMDDRLWQADAEALADRFGKALSVMRSAEAELGVVLVEIASRGVVDLYGYRSLARWVEHMAGISRHAADKLIKRAQALNPSHHVDGSVEPALAPLTGSAAREGVLSTPTIDAIVDTLRQIPAMEREWAEGQLLELASQAGPAQVAAAGQRIVAHLDPDGPEPDSTEPPRPERELSLRRKRNGAWELKGRFDDETGTRANALLDSLAERRTTDEGPDLRSPAERLGDAFSDTINLALNSPDLPTQAGERAHVTVAVSLQDLKTGLSNATLGDTGEITAAEARVHACDAMIIPAVLGGKNEPLNLGRLRHLISAGLRRALFLRDRGCAIPGCHRPPRHCQGHHVRHRADGGPTNLDNLVLPCSHHHRLLHKSGWEVRIAPDGLPEFIPPKYLDPRRRPRRNNLHPPLPFAA